METKRCSKCGEVKPISLFPKDKSMKDGYRTKCKCCMALYHAKYYDNNKDKILTQKKDYRKMNASARREYQREYINKDRQKWTSYQREWYTKNREKINKRRRDYYKRYTDEKKVELSEYHKEYATTNKDTLREYHKEYSKTRYKENPSIRIRASISTRIRTLLKDNTSGKKHGAIKYVGCNMSKLKAHLESQFTKGMTWDNYGYYGWHIDHIRPCASFDLTDPEQQKQCFHYTNLQPLWAEDNLRKSDKWEPVK